MGRRRTAVKRSCASRWNPKDPLGPKSLLRRRRNPKLGFPWNPWRPWNLNLDGMGEIGYLNCSSGEMIPVCYHLNFASCNDDARVLVSCPIHSGRDARSKNIGWYSGTPDWLDLLACSQFERLKWSGADQTSWDLCGFWSCSRSLRAGNLPFG